MDSIAMWYVIAAICAQVMCLAGQGRRDERMFAMRDNDRGTAAVRGKQAIVAKVAGNKMDDTGQVWMGGTEYISVHELET